MILKFNEEGNVDKLNWVNAADRAADTTMNKVSVRHINKVGVLAHCCDAFARAGWNVQQAENKVFKDRKAAIVSVLVEGDMSHAFNVKAMILENENILSVNFE